MIVYPYLAERVFENRLKSAAQAYEESVGQEEDARITDMLAEAAEYNRILAAGRIHLTDPFSEEQGMNGEEYGKLLTVSGTDAMGTIAIPCIGLTLPVYHGTDAAVLQKGIGHLEGSSLPVGGSSTHCVLTGHTGLSNARMFTDLIRLEVGDRFILSVFGQRLVYEVDQIRVVEPKDLSDLTIVPGRDYCTLVTCTPYGVNSHRLLVRGERTEDSAPEAERPEAAQEEEETVPQGSSWMNQYVLSLCAAAVFAVGAEAALRRFRKGRERRRDGL